MIEIKSLNKYYRFGKNNSEHVLKDIDVKINPGVNIILGPSGCGKSTLLNIISGLDSDYTGDVFIDDKNLSELNLDSYHKDEIGFIFQNFNLISHKTVIENLLISMYLDKDLNSSKRRDKAISLLKKVELAEYADKKPSELSGGQKQRVAIARALANDPNIIIADEPTGALDSNTSTSVIDLITSIAKEGKTVIIVTHDQSLKEYADNIIYMKDGKIDKLEEKNNSNFDKTNQSNAKKGISVSGILKTSFDNFKNRKFRNILVSVGSSIGIIGILLSLALGQGINNGVADIFSSIISPTTVTTTIKTDGIQTGPPTINMTNDEINEALSILEDGGVEENYIDYTYQGVFVSPTENVEDQILSEGTQDNYSMFLQILNYEDERQDNYTVDGGGLITGEGLDDNQEGILISKGLASLLTGIDPDELNEENTSQLINQELFLTLNFRTTTDTYDFLYPVAIKGILNASTFEAQAYGSQATFDEIFALTNEEPSTFSISSYTESSKEAEEFSKANEDNETFAFQTLGDVLGQISQFTSAITLLIAFVAGLSLVVAAVMISIVLYISVVERTKEIGIMRALGYSRNNIRILFLLEGIYIILLSNIIAIAISYIIALSVNPVISDATGFAKPIDITVISIIVVFLITLLVSILAGVFPARKAAKLDPATSLRYE